MRILMNIVLCGFALCSFMAYDALVPSDAASASSQSIDTVNADELMKLVEPHTGKVLLLNFFASWCPPCREEIPDLVSLRKKYGTNNVYILGISLDQKMSDVKNFVRKMNINYPVVKAAADIPRVFEVRSIPHNIIVDQDDNIILNKAGLVSEKELIRLIDKLLESK